MSEPPAKLPRHVAIIMDGNGRWARRRGLPRTEGHRAGADSVRAVAECCAELKIPVLTLFAFSTENWRRPRSEVRFLMSTLRSYLKERRDELVEKNLRLKAIGALEELPAGVQRELRATVEATRRCDGLTVVLALNYGAHREIADAARAIARKVERGELSADQVDERLFEQHLYTADLPPLDLMIRTAGETRVSNFLLWQLYYAEIYVTDTLWPDFRRDQFMEALRFYASRERRFGGLSPQGNRGRPRPGGALRRQGTA